MALQISTAFEKHGETFVPFDPVIPVFAISAKENNSTEADTLSTVLQSLDNLIKFN